MTTNTSENLYDAKPVYRDQSHLVEAAKRLRTVKTAMKRGLTFSVIQGFVDCARQCGYQRELTPSFSRLIRASVNLQFAVADRLQIK